MSPPLVCGAVEENTGGEKFRSGSVESVVNEWFGLRSNVVDRYNANHFSILIDNADGALPPN